MSCHLGGKRSSERRSRLESILEGVMKAGDDGVSKRLKLRCDEPQVGHSPRPFYSLRGEAAAGTTAAHRGACRRTAVAIESRPRQGAGALERLSRGNGL